MLNLEKLTNSIIIVITIIDGLLLNVIKRSSFNDECSTNLYMISSSGISKDSYNKRKNKEF